MRRRLVVGILMLCLVALLSAAAWSAYEFYVHITGMKGDCTQAGHEDWIEGISFIKPFGGGVPTLSSSMIPPNGSSGAGEILFSKSLDVSSPLLYKNILSGKSIPTLTIECCQGSGADFKSISYTLNDVVITSYKLMRIGRGSKSQLSEEIGLGYSTMSWSWGMSPR